MAWKEVGPTLTHLGTTQLRRGRDYQCVVMDPVAFLTPQERDRIWEQARLLAASQPKPSSSPASPDRDAPPPPATREGA